MQFWSSLEGSVKVLPVTQVLSVLTGRSAAAIHPTGTMRIAWLLPGKAAFQWCWIQRETDLCPNEVKEETQAGWFWDVAHNMQSVLVVGKVFCVKNKKYFTMKAWQSRKTKELVIHNCEYICHFNKLWDMMVVYCYSPKINECMNKPNYYVSFHSYRFMARNNKDKTEQQKCPQVLCTVTSKKQGDTVQGYRKVLSWLERTWSWESAKIHAEN